jgi:hypothetical protein
MLHRAATVRERWKRSLISEDFRVFGICTANSQILFESGRNLHAAFFTQRGKPLG